MAIQELDIEAAGGGPGALINRTVRSLRRGLTIALRTNSGRIGFAIGLASNISGGHSYNCVKRDAKGRSDDRNPDYRARAGQNTAEHVPSKFVCAE